MKRRLHIAFGVVVAAQVLLPLGIVGWNEWRLQSGTEVRLRTEPIDPLDVFRGRYVTLNYEISRLPVPGRVERGDTVYVILREESDAWTALRATTRRPSGDETFIRGRATYLGGGSGPVGLEYGIENYFTDEDRAQELERAGGTLYVDVALDDDGTARIKDVEPRA